MTLFVTLLLLLLFFFFFFEDDMKCLWRIKTLVHNACKLKLRKNKQNKYGHNVVTLPCD